MTTTRGALAATTALGLIFMAAPFSAHAETAAAAEKAGGFDIQEVVVTAQRRSERLVDVPLSVTALSVESLAKAGIQSTQDLGNATPGLFMIGGIAGTSQPSIRGITSTLTGGENNVSIYIDGVYQPNNRNTHFDLPDVESVEVLKGPQGTLFGRNATGGAILVNTRAPNLTEQTGMIYGSYGNYNTWTTKGFASMPLVQDKLALSVSGNYDHTDGWNHDLNQGGKRSGRIWEGTARAKLRFIPWEGADFTLSGYTLTSENRSAPEKVILNGNSTAVAKGIAVTSKPYTFSENVNGNNAHRDNEVSLHGDIEAGPGKFSTTTAFHHTVTYGRIDVDYTNDPSGGVNDAPLTTDSYEQEFLYTTHQIGRFHGVGGVFLFSSKVNSNLDLNLSPTTSIRSDIIDKAKSWAVFGEGTYDITDHLSVTGGLRYTSEERKSFASGVAVGPVKPLQFVGDHTWHSLTPRASILYKLTQHTNVYGTYSRGFTSGTFNSATIQAKPVDPEKVTAFEVGIKSNDIRNVSLSLAGFHYLYKDQQQNQQVFVNSAPIVTITNAAKSKIYGVEANGNWRVTDAFDLTAGASYIHARFASYPGAQIVLPKPGGGNVAATADLSGFHMLRTPEWSGNVTAHYRIEAANGRYDFSANATYLSKIYWDFANRLTTPGYVMANATATWAPASHPNLQLGVWMKNITDRAQATDIRNSTTNDNATYLRPRTFGVSAQYTY